MAAAEADYDEDQAHAHLNKAERKARKALSKLGLKPVKDVSVVTMKRSGMPITILNPEVFRAAPAGNQETYVAYGTISFENPQSLQQEQIAQYLAAQQQINNMHGAMPSAGPTITETAAAATGEPAAEKPAGSSTIPEKDIELVVAQGGVDRERAIEVLLKNEGDIVNAILELTS